MQMMLDDKNTLATSAVTVTAWKHRKNNAPDKISLLIYSIVMQTKDPGVEFCMELSNFLRLKTVWRHIYSDLEQELVFGSVIVAITKMVNAIGV